MVMTGMRIQIGTQAIERAPSYIEIFGRTMQLNLSRSRWFDFPFTREEALQADKKLNLFSESPAPSMACPLHFSVALPYSENPLLLSGLCHLEPLSFIGDGHGQERAVLKHGRVEDRAHPAFASASVGLAQPCWHGCLRGWAERRQA